MADSIRRRTALADRTNRTSGPASATRGKKLLVSAASADVVTAADDASQSSGCPVVGTQESRAEPRSVPPGVVPVQNTDSEISPVVRAESSNGNEENDGTMSRSLRNLPWPMSTFKLRGSREFCREEFHPVVTPSSSKQRQTDDDSWLLADSEHESDDADPSAASIAENTEATPAKRVSTTPENEFRTSENLMFGTGGAPLTSRENSGSEGRVKFYQRRKSQFLYERDLPKSCPQLGHIRSAELKRPRFQDQRSLHDSYNKPRRGRSTGYSKSSGDGAETAKNHDYVFEKVCAEKRAYFAEVDAFELEEEDEENEDEEGKRKRKENVVESC